MQRFGSPDVLTWGQERSFKAAQHAALQWVADTGNRRRVSKILGHVTESGMFFAGHALRLSIAARAALLIDDLYVEKP